MKNTLLFVFFLVLPLAFIACNKDKDEVVLDFDITFPDNWTSNVYQEQGFVMDATRNQVNANDSFPESVVVFRTAFASGNTTVYYENLKPQIQKSDAYDSVLYESDTTISIIDFKKMLSQEHLRYIEDYTRDTIVVPVITERYFVFHNGFGYNLTFVAVNDAYPEAKQVFEDIMGTFSFKE